MEDTICPRGEWRCASLIASLADHDARCRNIVCSVSKSMELNIRVSMVSCADDIL